MAAIINQKIDLAVELLQRGDLVAIPTETVYGLSGNGLATETIAQIFAVKARPTFDPLILHISDLQALDEYAQDVSPRLLALAEHFWPGPLTIVVTKRPIVPDIVTSGLDTVAIRVPAHPLTRELLGRLAFPLAAPSANPFGYVSPTTPQHVADQLGDQIPMILDGGPCTVGLESTIVTEREGNIIILRKGGLSVERIEAVVGTVLIADHSSSNPQAPGMLASHYATRTRIVLSEDVDISTMTNPTRVGRLSLTSLDDRLLAHNQAVLSPSGDLTEAAANLFASMRQLDALDLDLIVADLVPDHGLGRAINDKLRRASV